MKKALIFSIIAVAAAAFGIAAKEVFVKGESNVLKKVVEVKSNSKQWPVSTFIFKDDLSAGKTAGKNWKCENGELVGTAGDNPLFINGAKGVYSIAFEFNADEAGEGYFFVRAPKGDTSKAVRIKLSQLNTDKGETSIGSINGAIKPGNKFDETKHGRFTRFLIFVEEENVRISPNTNLCGHYADRRFLSFPYETISQKSGYEIAPDGEAGFVCEKGTLKFKNILFAPFSSKK
ncbi:MAG: hypothetical protein IKO42_04295 [Opitutales bacterium]|nr:hypothetical protein [Opitutales bacterium]